MSTSLAAILYLISGILFILALRGLSSPETSRRGNFFGILGMITAIVVTFLSINILFNGLIYILIASEYSFFRSSGISLSFQSSTFLSRSKILSVS